MTTPKAGVPDQASVGPAVDAAGDPVVDPSANVFALVQAAIQRQDDLRTAESRHLRELLGVREECANQLRAMEQDRITLRAKFDEQLRDAESKRIDAIRAVDVGAVQRAAEVAAAQAEALRNQVAAAATATAAALAAALDPIQKSIDDLRRAQYEAQGQKTQVVESRGTSAALYAAIGFGITILLAVLTIAAFVLANK